MGIIRLPVTKRELAKCVADYQTAFPTWLLEHEVVLARYAGPIRQVIAFEALRGRGYYRPSSSVNVLVSPSPQLLFSFLDVRHRQIDVRFHAQKWPQIVNVMEEQFLPQIRKVLNVEEVIQLAEREVLEGRAGNIRYLSGVACLNAYVGATARAISWCDKADALLAVSGYSPAEWELEAQGLIKRLRDAVAQNRVRSIFDRVSMKS